MNKYQLEMSFESSMAARPLLRRHRRLTRARWWFAQMRQVVDSAWEPATSAGPGPARPSLAEAPVKN